MKSKRYVTKAAVNIDQEKDVQHVYVKSKEHVWVPALQVKNKNKDSNGGKTADVVLPVINNKRGGEQDLLQCGRRQKYTDQQSVNLSDYPSNVLPMQNVDSSGNLQDYKDMVSLPYVHEAAILYNLKLRHIREKPYTRTGDIVIAVNPYQWFDDLYSEKKQAYYSKRLVWDSFNNNNADTSTAESNNNDPRETMEAHVYEVSALAYKGLSLEGQDQSILVSGESGAGKTETVKICLNHIASIQRGNIPVGYGGTDNGKDAVVERILESNPLLEAFGNAKTRRNDNSSRFGKYMQLQFNNSGGAGRSCYTPRCALVGSVCEVYLLEKNRVVKHDPDERTFHIFYQLLAAPDKLKNRIWGKLVGMTKLNFSYIGDTDTNSIEGVTDANRFLDTIKALELIGVKDDKLHDLMRAICVVMQIGNLKFSGDADTSKVVNANELAALAKLMGVSNDDLKHAFTERTFTTKDETHKIPLSAEAAIESRDAMAKEIYQKAFLWLVNAINEATCAKSANGKASSYGVIGMLDIFGFEAFKTNHFEQLCINYANEKLQQKFNEDIFRNVQAEYKLEGIPLEEIFYDDNTDVLDLIEGRTGLLALLNEECHRPKGNDASFVHKITQMHKVCPAFMEHKTDNLSFGIHHYAGVVMYDAETFVSRNQDTLSTDLQECCEKSSNAIIKQPRSENVAEKKITSTALKRGVSRRGLRPTVSNIVAPTIWEKYKNQLATLMSNLRKTKSRYIRCIKPNSTKTPLLIEHESVVEQLRCAGVVAGITISRSVFPNRLDNAIVLSRYSSLWNEMEGSHDDSFASLKSTSFTFCTGATNEKRVKYCNKLLKKILKHKERTDKDTGKVTAAFFVGRTKTYFRAGALEWLEAHRKSNSRISDVEVAVTMIQALARGWLVRNDGHDSGLARLRYEKEQRERLDALERERLAGQREAAKDRIRAMQAQKADLMRKIQELERETDQENRNAKQVVKKASERKQMAELQVENLRDDIADFEKKHNGGRDARIELARQKQRLEEQKKVIAWLRKENTKVRKIHDKVADKMDLFKNNSQKLYDGNSSMRGLFDELDDDTHKVQVRNNGLLDAHAASKSLNDELKKKVNAMQDKYMGEAEARLELQKTMARVLNLIQERCAVGNKDGTMKNAPEIVEESVVRALDCEANAKAVMAGITAELEENCDHLPDMTISDNSDSDISVDMYHR